MHMAYENLIIADSGFVRTITLNRPKALNALNKKTLTEIEQAFLEIEANSGIRTVILTGAGDKSFVAGADIHEMKSFSPIEAERFSRLGHRVLDTVSACRVPVIAAVNGYALGGGLELALACDFIYASEHASFGLVEAKLGLIPGFGGNARLMRRVGDAMAREMIFSALQLNAAEAFRTGLVNRVTQDGEVVRAAQLTAEKIGERGPYAVSLAKVLLRHADGMSLQAANAMEQRAFGLVFSTQDHIEGIEAFVEKRIPTFEGI